MNINSLGGNSGEKGGGGNKTKKSGNTQVIVKKQQKTKQQIKETIKPKSKQPAVKKGKGVVIGEESSDEKWRCEICTFTNSIELTICKICGSSKDGQQIQKEQKQKQ